jgi:transposase
MESFPVTCRTFEEFYHIKANTFERQYKDHLSGYRNWEQLSHADEWLLLPENMGERLCIDETALSDGELYTFVTNPASHGRKGCFVAIVRGVRAEDVIPVLMRIEEGKRMAVREITMDLSSSMHLIARQCFPKAIRTIDRFHVQKLAIEALQELRIAHRWDAIQDDNDAREEARLAGERYEPVTLTNGDTPKQLLARSRYLLFKSPEKWTGSQKARASILFERYPDLKEAYSLTHSLRMIFSRNTIKDAARTSLARWYNKVEEAGFKSFNVIAATLYEHYDEVLNFFVNRNTNAFAESFNSKVKAFRRLLRGIVDVKFFLFRLCKIYG